MLICANVDSSAWRFIFFARSLMISRTALHSSGRLKVVQVCVEIVVQSCLMRILRAVGLIRISSANFRQ